MIPDIRILPADQSDLEPVRSLFQKVMALQGQDGYRVWNTIDLDGLELQIARCLQYKLLLNGGLAGCFSIQLQDPFIWPDGDRADALYLHRIATDPAFRGHKLFRHICDWALEYARLQRLSRIRMDTWAGNHRLIAYYQSYGFVLTGHHTTPDVPELPLQNRNLRVALLERRSDVV